MRCLRLAQTIRASGSGLRIASCLGGVVVAISRCPGSHLRRGGRGRSHRSRLRICPKAENANRRADYQMLQWLLHTSPFAKEFSQSVSPVCWQASTLGWVKRWIAHHGCAASQPIIRPLADRRWHDVYYRFGQKVPEPVGPWSAAKNPRSENKRISRASKSKHSACIF